MKLPYLLGWDKTPVVVHIVGDIDENGVPEVLGRYEGLGNFSQRSQTVVDADGRQVSLGGVLRIKGDIFPSSPAFGGSVEIEGATRVIHQAAKVRNPDGSVHHTRLELL